MSLTPELSLMELPVNVKVCCNPVVLIRVTKEHDEEVNMTK